MKVLVVGTGGAVVSGITSAADQMVTALHEVGVEVRRVEAGAARRRRPSRLNLENVLAVVSDSREVHRSVRRHGADVVWYHTFGVPTLAAARALAVGATARVAGARSITHFHAYALEEWLARAGRPLRWILRILDRVSSEIVVLYDGARVALEEECGLRSVVVLENWVDVPVQPSPFPPPSPFVLAFVGGLIDRKGVRELIGAVRQVGVEVRVRLVGSAAEDGDDAQERLEAEVDDLVRTGRVSLAGELDRDGVRDALRSAHAFVLPTKAEGLPLAMLEAMAEGRPVIVGDAGGIRSVVEGAGAGVVLDTLDPAEIAAAIDALAGDPVSAGRMGANGHRYAAAQRRKSLRTLASLLGSPAPAQ